MAENATSVGSHGPRRRVVGAEFGDEGLGLRPHVFTSFALQLGTWHGRIISFLRKVDGIVN